MSYVLVGILVLLIASGLVLFLVLTATKRSGHATAQDGDSAAPGIGSDSSPLGDSDEHAGEQEQGETVAGADVRSEPGSAAAPAPGRRFQRDPIGGEAEARPFGGEGDVPNRPADA